MNGLEFAWRMSDMLIWPLVVLTGLVLYRGRITTILTGVTEGRRIKSLEAANIFKVEWEDKAGQAGRNMAGVLAGTAPPPAEDGPIPTNLVDLIATSAADPRRGIRLAFKQVRRALEHVHPQLSGVGASELPD